MNLFLATKQTHTQRLADFQCCSDEAPEWATNVEGYFNRRALAHSHHLLAFHDAATDRLIAVVAARRTIKPIDQGHERTIPAWFLPAIAVDLSSQRSGVGADALVQTLDWLRNEDPEMLGIFACISPANTASLALFERSGFSLWGHERSLNVLARDMRP